MDSGRQKRVVKAGIGVMTWHGDERMAGIKRHQKNVMEAATREVRNGVIRRIGVRFPPASVEGEPPHLRTGQLRRSISTEVVEDGDNYAGRVGTNLAYAKYLELPEYLNRSFLLSTLNMMRDRVRDILSKKMK